MDLRGYIRKYSKGNALNFFWFCYRHYHSAGSKAGKDIFAFLLSRSAHRHGGYVGPGAVFRGEVFIPHGLHGVFISRYAVIGRNCWIYQNVTIGEAGRRAPVIGDNCLIGANAVIVGDIRIGNNVRIGAGAVVFMDIPDNCTVVSESPRIIERGGNG